MNPLMRATVVQGILILPDDDVAERHGRRSAAKADVVHHKTRERAVDFDDTVDELDFAADGAEQAEQRVGRAPEVFEELEDDGDEFSHLPQIISVGIGGG